MTEPSQPVLTLTSSDRLARALREDYSLRRQQSGDAVWEAPAVQSLRQWLQDVWTASWPAEQLLHSAQELALWRDVIAQDASGQALLAPLSAAREARRADQIARRHLITVADTSGLRDDHAAFLRWRREVRTRMQRRGWLTAADLLDEVSRGLRQGRIPAPRHVRLAGFVAEPAPAEQALFAALGEAGSQLEFADPPQSSGATVARQIHTDAETQFRALAQAVRQRLAPFADHARPPPRLVLALPDPEARRDLIESVFRPVLAPWLQAPAAGSRPIPWRWDAGQPLTMQPQIADALAIAELRSTDNPPARIGRVLLSPSLWTDDERLVCARADWKLRDRGWPRLSLARVLEALPHALQERFGALADVIHAAPRRALPSAWADHWRARLAAIRRPGGAQPDSAGYQALREWDRLLSRLAAMDAQLAQVPSSEALTWLRELARAARFDARVEYTVPLLIVKLEDAAGMPCDALYLADLGIDRFPARDNATPYLPLGAQIAAGVPGAAPARSLAQARLLAAHLCTLAPEVTMMVPAVDDRGAPLAPSPVFGAEADWQPAATPHIDSPLARIVALGVQSALPAADPVPAVSAYELTKFRAGSALFKAWYESPFFAFCRFRLGIDPLPAPTRGLDARRQGNVTHQVLQQLWTDLRDSTVLAATSDDALAQQIAALLLPALEHEMPAADYGRVQVALERARLADVIGQWMRHERRRLDPFVVTHTEAAAEARVGGLPLKLRIDRVDRVRQAGGEDRWLVIDYKTGREARPEGWKAERLAEPQLPLYASHALTDAMGVPRVDGICFAHLKDGHPAFSAETNWRKKLIEGDAYDDSVAWDDKLDAWRDQLEQSAIAFLSGVAGIKPKVGDRASHAYLLLLAGREVDES